MRLRALPTSTTYIHVYMHCKIERGDRGAAAQKLQLDWAVSSPVVRPCLDE